MATVTRLDVVDVRFPTSAQLDGSDAMNPDPDYSAAYATLHVDDGSTGHGFVFTIGRGNDVVTAALPGRRGMERMNEMRLHNCERASASTVMLRASERQRASAHTRPAWPGNAMNGLRGGGTQ